MNEDDDVPIGHMYVVGEASIEPSPVKARNKTNYTLTGFIKTAASRIVFVVYHQSRQLSANEQYSHLLRLHSKPMK